MLLNTWGLALSILSASVLFLMFFGCRTAVMVLRYWDPESDSNRQIRLESEIWLSSSLVEYALFIQIISLIVFVLAADDFCQVIVGAMCATGTLQANEFGMPALSLKLVGVFAYGCWLVLHKLDVSVESYPLVRIKYILLLVLLPLLLTDIVLQTLYLVNLNPEIITSCCGVIFEPESSRSVNLVESVEQKPFLILYYSVAAWIVLVGSTLKKFNLKVLYYFYASVWTCFLVLGFIGITALFSSYIYAMPFHHCPFCILKKEYSYIGFALYGTLIPGAFFGMVTGVIPVLSRIDKLEDSLHIFKKKAIYLSFVFLFLFLGLSSYHLVFYKLAGGEL